MMEPDPTTGPAVQFERLASIRAELTGAIRWHSVDGVEPALEHDLAIDLREPGSEASAVLQLLIDSARMPVNSWRQLPGATFRFPTTITTLYADGDAYPVYDIYASVAVDGGYNAVGIDVLRFGDAEGCRVAVEIEGRLEPGNDAPFVATPFRLAVTADLGPVRVEGDVAVDDYPDADLAEDLARRLLDLDAYLPGASVDGCVTFAPRCGEEG